jgi:hypothetical protein
MLYLFHIKNNIKFNFKIKNMKSLNKSLLTIGAISLPVIASAQQVTYGRPIIEALSTVQLIFNILNVLLPALAVLLFFWLVISFIWKKTQGTAKAEDNASLVWGIIALAVIFGVYGLVRLTASFVGVNTDGSTRITAPSLPQVAR